jgi:hypothetical protein
VEAIEIDHSEAIAHRLLAAGVDTAADALPKMG